MSPDERPALTRSAWVRIAIGVVAAAALVAAAFLLDLPSQSELRSALDRFGAAQYVGFVVFYAAVTCLPVPKSVCTIAAGVFYGLSVGIVLVIVGATIGATAAFGLSRWLGLDGINALGGRRVERLQEQVRSQGFGTVLVLRLIPLIPFTPLNYGLGLTAVRWSSYVTATALGIVPGVCVYVAVGAYGLDPGSREFYLTLAALSVLTLGTVLASRVLRARTDLAD